MEIGRRARKHQQTRAAIVDAALQLFTARGFDATSIEEIAAAADVAPRTFYRYFPTKEDVIFDNADAEAALRLILSERETGESDVRLVARALHGALAVNEARVVQTRELVLATPSLRGRAFQTVERSTEVLAEHLASRSEKGRDARLRAHVVASGIAAAVRTGFFAWVDGGRRGKSWTYCEKALDILGHALRDVS